MISHVVYDSTWEKAVADLCEKEPCVVAWAKNDHLDFKIRYLYRGSSRNFVPDCLIRLDNGKTLILEVKGQDTEQNRVKRAAMQTWIQAVNEQGGFGTWCFDVVFCSVKDTGCSYGAYRLGQPMNSIRHRCELGLFSRVINQVMFTVIVCPYLIWKFIGPDLHIETALSLKQPHLFCQENYCRNCFSDNHENSRIDVYSDSYMHYSPFNYPK